MLRGRGRDSPVRMYRAHCAGQNAGKKNSVILGLSSFPVNIFDFTVVFVEYPVERVLKIC